MSAVAILAAKKYLQGTGPWKLDEIGIGADDYLVTCFAQAIEQERAAVVDYLWLCAVQKDARGTLVLEQAASAIALGEHIKEAP